MQSQHLSRYAAALCVAAALAGCGGSQPPIGAPGAMPLDRAIAEHAARGKSWMPPEASGQDLIYVTAFNLGKVYVFTYPQGQPVATLSVWHPIGECTDEAGDIFVVTQGSQSSDSSQIYEYAHGGTTPISVLNDPGYAVGCAVDPNTGSLAVGNVNDVYNPYYSNHGDVAVYAGAQGNPTMYYSADFTGFGFCGYDSADNLYVEGLVGSSQKIELAQLASGGNSLELIELNRPVYATSGSMPSVQWDGSHMTISTENPNKNGPVSIYRLKISRSTANVVSTTKLKSKKNRHGGQSWIQGKAIAGVSYSGAYGDVSFWNYPNGGRPTGAITKIAPLNKTELWGVAISLAQQH
jgi:hypothetical protein